MKWSDVEAKRALTRISRAEMCRRAGISESTVTKGLRRDTDVTRLIQAAVMKVLIEAATKQDDAA